MARSTAPRGVYILLLCAATGISTCAQTFTTLATFDVTNGNIPNGNGPNANAPLVQGTDGNLYGTAFGGGPGSGGAVFKVSLDGTLTTLAPFPGSSDSSGPRGGVVQGTDGNFYGTTENGGISGTIFKVTPSGALTTIYSFGTASTDGVQPQGGLVQATDRNFYGTTGGTIFRVTPAGVLTTIYSGATGTFPFGSRLIQGTDGNLYGIGGGGDGNVFRTTLTGELTTLYSFTNATDGVGPRGWLVQATDGNFYGATTGGGTAESGTVFRLTPVGVLTTLYNLIAKTDGTGPNSGLIQAADGNFYGTTAGGGANGRGTIYRITPAGAFTTLYSFSIADGNVSDAGLLQASDGNLYGTTDGGGPGGGGTIFKLTLPSTTTGTPGSSTYYFPHLAFGGGFQTTLTYVNYSPQSVSCQTTFYSDSGGALQVPFTGGNVSNRSDNLAPGASIHVQTQAGANDPLVSGWSQAQCTGPVKASLLYRVYSGGIAQGEAGVNGSTTPTTEFVTFAQTQTGVAYANPSATPATVTITALNSTGASLGSTSFVLQPNAHGAANIGPLLNLNSFTGSVQITSTVPIVSLSLNAEAYPVFSSLPPGDLPATTQLANGSGQGSVPTGPASTYYFPHLAFGGGFQTTLTYVNYSPQSVSCQTTFYSDSGGALQVPFTGGNVSNRSDGLGPGASIHVQTQAGANDPLVSGWSQAQCTGPVKASLLYRVYSGGVAQGEAGVNGSTTPTTEFVTFAQTQTGVAYANPSATPATVTITALDSTGASLGSTSFVLQPNAHGAANIGPLLNLNSFTGSVQITSTVPIVSLSLNAEAYPVFSSLPPGDLPASTPLATGH